jgi:hypothetical protein
LRSSIRLRALVVFEPRSRLVGQRGAVLAFVKGRIPVTDSRDSVALRRALPSSLRFVPGVVLALPARRALAAAALTEPRFRARPERGLAVLVTAPSTPSPTEPSPAQLALPHRIHKSLPARLRAETTSAAGHDVVARWRLAHAQLRGYEQIIVKARAWVEAGIYPVRLQLPSDPLVAPVEQQRAMPRRGVGPARTRLTVLSDTAQSSTPVTTVNVLSAGLTLVSKNAVTARLLRRAGRAARLRDGRRLQPGRLAAPPAALPHVTVDLSLYGGGVPPASPRCRDGAGVRGAKRA